MQIVESSSLTELGIEYGMGKTSRSKPYTFLLVLFPLICNYNFIKVSPTLVLCLIESILVLVCKAKDDPILLDTRIFIYLAYMLISSIVGICNSEQNSIYTILMKCIRYVVFFFVFYVFSWQVIDLEYAKDLYIKVAAIASILVMIQFVFARLGHRFSLVLPGIPIVGEDGTTSDYIRLMQITNNRLSSVFFEPAHQCEYVIPCLALLLFGEDEKKRTKNIAMAILLTIGCFCTTSTIGILSSVIIWGFWVLTVMKQRGVNGLLYLIVIIPMVFCIVFYFLGFENVSQNVFTRLAVLNFRNTTVSEGFRRVKYGWLCYGDMDLFHKLFGAGYQNFGYYIAKIGTGYKYYRTNDISWISYTNGITGMLIGLGVIGTILNFRLYLWDLIKSKDLMVYGLLLSWALIMFTSDSFDDAAAMLPLVLAMSIALPQNRRKFKLSIRL